ncbi:MAG TPA: LuxR C-terminal-related transcriptional regulator [Solirubrobacteraceae bacterium]|jgi:DNA-binding CsgD family transcriptional regulator|nr:LuxR C-terminal-related transcriptional regulator [Solirubrobacteraceae bacterium]
MASIAAVASSGASVEERAHAVIECFRAIVPFAAAALSIVDQVSGEHRTLVNHGYAPALASYLTSPGRRREVIEPFALPRRGWPLRRNDLTADPGAVHEEWSRFHPAGLGEWLVSASVAGTGRHVAVIDMALATGEELTEEACAVIGLMAPTVAHLLDPLESAAALAALLDSSATAIALMPDGSTIPLRDDGSDRARALEALSLERALGEWTVPAAFLWPAAPRIWLKCTMNACRDGVAVLIACDADVHAMTQRELEVLTCVIEGRTNAEIATELSITVRTVKAHVGSILAKLGVHTRAGAAARGRQEGLVLPHALPQRHLALA